MAALATNFVSLPYPDSNGLTQRDRDYFRMVRTENGFSDLVVVAKEGKEKVESNRYKYRTINSADILQI